MAGVRDPVHFLVCRSSVHLGKNRFGDRVLLDKADIERKKSAHDERKHFFVSDSSGERWSVSMRRVNIHGSLPSVST